MASVGPLGVPGVRRTQGRQRCGFSGFGPVWPVRSGRPKTGEPPWASVVCRWFYRARLIAGRGDVRLHDLWHFAVTMAAQAGVTVPELMARSRNMSELARRVGMSRDGLYKALSADGNPTWSTILKVTEALGLRFELHTVA